MAYNIEKSFAVRETLDQLKGVSQLAQTLPTEREGQALVRFTLPLIDIESIVNRFFSINASRAFAVDPENPEDIGDELNDIEFFGRTGVPGKMFQYKRDDGVPLEDLSVILFEPVVPERDLEDELGYVTPAVKVPVWDISSLVSIDPS